MLTFIHDVHIGVNRSAGTTPASALALREYLLQSFKNLLDRTDSDLVILGDLFDSYQVPMTDLLKTYQHLETWLTKGYRLWLVNGNHDLSTDSTRLSSFEFLAALLVVNPSVRHVSKGEVLDQDVYVIPHVLNQDLFDLELSKVPECSLLLLHCNYDNFFARESDHSLNMSKQQATDCKADKIYFAHEHHARTELAGRIVVGGNQVPSSVSDCLDGHSKYLTTFSQGRFASSAVWDCSKFVEVDWRDLLPYDAQFVRVKGHATPAEAAAMTEAIASFRRSSDAFVVSNAVSVGDDVEGATLNLNSLETLRKFDVMSALREVLSKEEVEVLEKLQ